MLSKIISGVVLYTAVIVGAAPAAGQNGSDADLRQCVNRLRGSIWESGGMKKMRDIAPSTTWCGIARVKSTHGTQASRSVPRHEPPGAVVSDPCAAQG